MIITSVENNKIKQILKLQRKKYRDETNTYFIEGFHLVQEAKRSGLLKEVFVVENDSFNIDMPITYVSSDVMKKISTTDTYTNVVGLCEKKNSNEIIGDKILLLDDIQDPGNLGTIIRSSVAFNVDTIILSPNTVDLYNSKVLISTQAMFCHINIITMDLKAAINTIKDRGITVYGTNVNNGEDVSNINDTSSYALIMGNEGNGVSLDIQNMCDKNLYIKMSNKTESLNVGVACSILLYELEK